MNKFKFTFRFNWLYFIFLAVSACGGGGTVNIISGLNNKNLNISGVAAVGDAIVSGTVSAKCKSGSGSGTTNNDGTYALYVSGGEAPCILRAIDPISGKTYHSLLESGQDKSNITPLTELIVSNVFGVEPGLAYADYSEFRQFLVSSINIAESKNIVNSMLMVTSSNLSISNFDPLKSDFIPRTSSRMGDLTDQKIDLLMSTLIGFSKDLPDLVDYAKSAKSQANAENAMRAFAGNGSVVSFQTLGFTGGENSNGGSIRVGGVDVVIPNGSTNDEVAEDVKVAFQANAAFSNHIIERRENTLLVIFPPSISNPANITFSGTNNPRINMTLNAPSGIIGGVNYGANPWSSFINNSSVAQFQTLGFTGADNSNGGSININGVSVVIPIGLTGNQMTAVISDALKLSVQFANHIIERKENTLVVIFPPSLGSVGDVTYVNTNNSRVNLTINAPSGVVNGINFGNNPYSIFFKLI